MQKEEGEVWRRAAKLQSFRCVARNETCVYKLSPTLSYTQKLEARVKELEDLVSQLQMPPDGCIPTSSLPSYRATSQNALSLSETTMPELLGTFEGLKFDDKGGITYHGATSFFQLPTPTTQNDSSNATPWETSDDLYEGGRRKERLVNNAWQQRALETLSETPVSLSIDDVQAHANDARSQQEPFQFLLKAHWCWIQPLFNFVYRPAFTRRLSYHP
jgi:hypothetical protein